MSHETSRHRRPFALATLCAAAALTLNETQRPAEAPTPTACAEVTLNAQAGIDNPTAAARLLLEASGVEGSPHHWGIQLVEAAQSPDNPLGNLQDGQTVHTVVLSDGTGSPTLGTCPASLPRTR